MQAEKEHKCYFPERLKIALTQNNMKQKELASILGIQVNTISRYCTGKIMPSSAELYRISLALGVSMDWLWGKQTSKINEDAILWKSRYDDCQKELESLRNALKLLVNNVSK